tara:strand:+ start:4856 stop:5194 length:339 start_codon:yes stop_codon:yes gene_type:complete
MKLLQKIKNIMNLKQSMKRFGTKNLKESNLLKEAAANQQNWLKGYFKKQEGDEGTWKIGRNGNLEIYVDGKLAGNFLADDELYIPNELMGDLNKGRYNKPYQEPSNDEPFDY